MSAAKKLDLISEADYLASELQAEIKHEYLGGVVYAMAGARNRHNRIAVNILGTLFAGLKGRPCQPCDSDTKIRIRMPGHTRFYYPGASVACQPNPETDSFEDLSEGSTPDYSCTDRADLIPSPAAAPSTAPSALSGEWPAAVDA